MKKILIFAIIPILSLSGGAFIIMKKDNTYATQWISNNTGKECVVLVHGLFRDQNSMSRIAEELSARGYNIMNFGYDSRSKSIDEIAENFDDELKKIPGDIKHINFVTHSLGSIIVRYYLSKYDFRKTKRFIMIAPPNKGSVWGERILKYIPYAAALLGKPIQELYRFINDKNLIPACEFGVIAGGAGNKLGLNPFIPGDNDMTICVDETKLEGMTDFVVIKGQHSMLLKQDKVIENIINFLKFGEFIQEK